MELTSSNNSDKVEKIEPQIEDVQFRESKQSQDHQQANSNAQHEFTSQENFSSKESHDKYRTHNPLLDFVKNVGETAEYLWEHYLDWVIHVSWGKMFLACLLILIAGSCLFLHSLANWFVFGSLLLKCFVGKEDRQTKNSANEQVTPEEN